MYGLFTSFLDKTIGLINCVVIRSPKSLEINGNDINGVMLLQSRVTAAYGSYPVCVEVVGFSSGIRISGCFAWYIKNVFLLKQTKKAHHRNVIGVHFSFSLMWQMLHSGVKQLSIRKARDSTRSDPQYFSIRKTFLLNFRSGRSAFLTSSADKQSAERKPAMCSPSILRHLRDRLSNRRIRKIIVRKKR